jgi:VanZ family protein
MPASMVELDLSRTLIGAKPWQQRSSPLARVALGAYVVIVIYAGLAPWSGWRDLGISPFAYLWSPLPRHLTTFDLAVNVLAYLPLGALAVLALHPRLRGVAALLAAVLLALAVAGTVETLQSFLPRRVASNIDLATNTAGGALGALLALPFAGGLIDRGRLAQWRARRFAPDASALLVLLALWPAAQVWPGAMLFGNGQWFDGGSLLGARQAGAAAVPGGLGAAWGPSEFVLAEALVVAAGTLAAGLALACAMRSRETRLPLLLALVAAALGTKAFAYAVSFGPERAFMWLTPGAFGGLTIGLLALAIASLGPPRAQLAGALLACVVWLAAVNLVPDNPYHADWLAAYRPGRLAHFHALAEWIALAWPWLLLLVLTALAVGRARWPGRGAR